MNQLLTPNPLVSFVITVRATARGEHGLEARATTRADALADTVAQIERCGLRRDEMELLVVDRSGPDEATRRLAGRFPLVYMMTQADSARFRTLTAAIATARGRFVVVLEDDCHPRPGALTRMVMHFDAQPSLAAVVFSIHDADGTYRAGVSPSLISRQGTGFRRRFLEQVPLPPAITDGTGEMDLSLRLLSAGYQIKTFDDIHITRHSPTAQDEHETVCAGVRDSVLLPARFFPQKWIMPFAKDWVRRQRFLAASRGRQQSYFGSLLRAMAGALNPAHRRTVDDRTFESVAKIDQTESRMRKACHQFGLRSVLLVDYSPSLLAFWLAARNCSLRVAAIADQQLAGPYRSYRGVKIMSDQDAVLVPHDASIIATLDPIQAAERARRLGRMDARPVIALYDSAAAAAFTCADQAEPEAHRIAARIA